jgi:hypothetical protein
VVEPVIEKAVIFDDEPDGPDTADIARADAAYANATQRTGRAAKPPAGAPKSQECRRHDRLVLADLQADE